LSDLILNGWSYGTLMALKWSGLTNSRLKSTAKLLPCIALFIPHVQVSLERLFRNHYVQKKSSRLAGPDVFHVEDVQVPVTTPMGEITVRIYSPEGSGPFPVHLNFHGGKTHDSFDTVTK
jgi:acetyl esterase/lipase